MKLHHLIQQFVAFRQALGERFHSNAKTLRAFGRAFGPDVDAGAVTAEQVNAFLTGTGPITRTYHSKYRTLLGLYRYAASRGYVTTIPLPVVLPKQPPPFVPYIYSHEELRCLLDATSLLQKREFRIDPLTMRTIVLVLYGTALRSSEAVNLNRSDIDLNNAVLTVRQTKFFKTRLVPFGPQLGGVLTHYVQRTQTATAASPDQDPFFTTRIGGRVKQGTLQATFQRMREHAGIRRPEGVSYQPRLHDLRHSAAVHRLVCWYRQGADVQKLLPQLSVFLGHAHLSDTQVYLSMTPELLQEANQRFERYACTENNHD